VSYEYNPASSRFEIANPHRVENAFLFLASAVNAAFAAFALVEARVALASSLSNKALAPIAIAAILLAVGIGFAVAGLRQLRFFFGRNQPAGLVTELPAGTEGQPDDSRELRDTLRQNAIKYRVPTGALDNLLYSLAADLVFSPGRTQRLARTAFHNTVVLAFLLACFAWSVIGTHSAGVRDWLGVLYLAIAVYVLRPSGLRGDGATAVSPRVVIALVILGVIAPVVLPHILGDARMPLAAALRGQWLLFAVLGCGLTASGLLLTAVLAQQVKPNQIAMAQSLQTLSMNAPPNQIVLEFDRVMQRGWTEQIPNRTYLRTVPRTDGTSGPFDGHAIEETQPVPQDNEALSLTRCLSMREYRWLFLLDIFALCLAVLGGWLLLAFAEEPSAYWQAALGAALLYIAYASFALGNQLWRRFEFTSRVYWLEMQGNYQRAKSSVGVVLHDRVKTEKELVTVEDMTLRVWVAELDSVCFGPDAERSLMSIRGLPDEAAKLSAYLADFARGQATVIAPEASVDRERLDAMSRVNAAARSGSATGAVPSLPTGHRPDPPLPSANDDSARYCPQCGTRSDETARYCARCGTPLDRS
jgi:zinc-ribbon domain